MKDLNAQEHAVSEHYENSVIDYEKIRLEQDSPVEFAVTLRLLDQWIDNQSTVLDIGVGVGHYAHHLAKRGCSLHLADICDSFLNLTQKRLSDDPLCNCILSSTRTSATNLHMIGDASVDCVLMLGPLYHLIEKSQRDLAVREAHRVLKKGGILFAAGINRLAILHELFNSNRFFKDKKIDIAKINVKLEEYCRTGINDKTIFPPLGDAYCATVEEFRALFFSALL